MSKKIMKRSLALGALMAFVITGSAWAADISDITGDVQVIHGIGNYDGSPNANPNASMDKSWTLGNKTLWVDEHSGNTAGWSTYAVAADYYSFVGDGNSTLKVVGANETKLTNGLGIAGNINVGNLNIDVNTYGISSYGNTTVTANNIVIDAGYIALQAAEGGNIKVKAKESLNINGKGAAAFAQGAYDVIEIASYDGNKADIIVVGDIYSNGKVDLKLETKDSSLVGAAVMSENAQINVTLGNGATWNVTDDSTVSGIVVNDGATINGGGNALTLNKTITEKGKYAITHNGGTLTIKNLTIEDVAKAYNKQSATDNGIVYASVLYSNNSGKIFIEDSFIQDNSNTGDCKNYAIIDVTTNMDIKNTEFKNNQSSYMGGALYLHNKEFNITDSKFISNTALQGAAMQTNSATVTLDGNTFKNNVATKTADGDCGGAICAQGAGVITFKGTNTFDGNKATGTNGCGGAIAQYYKGSKIVFEKDSYTEFTNNTANGNGGAIWNGADAVIEVNGDLVFTGNTAGKKGNDIYNMSALKFIGGNTKVSGGIVSEGANAYVEISKDAVVELNGGATSLNKLQGNGGVIHFSSADAQLAVVENTNETLKFTATSAVNEAVAGDANALVSEVDWAADTTMVMEAGDIVGEVTAELGENKDTGKLIVKSQTEAANPANQAISDAGVGLKLHYRYHMNDMNKRMGELRNANGEHGVWTRMVRGECEYENSKAQYNQYQLGYDEKLSVDKRWTVGAAVTFSEGDSSYGYGSTEDKSTAFAIYGSKLNNDGTFVDLIARYAHLESDIEDKAGKGNYSTNGMSVSAEFGKRIQQGNGLWIEPQFELTYGNIDSAEFQIGGKTVQVGDMDSLIGRLGFSLGKDIKKGNVYARASYLYDFDGETETAFSNTSATRTFNDDLGGGWWEVGVGANINLSKATYIYADVEKTFGGEVDTNWQWNLGVRYSF